MWLIYAFIRLGAFGYFLRIINWSPIAKSAQQVRDKNSNDFTGRDTMHWTFDGFPLAFVAGSLQGHWWGFIIRNYVLWPIFFLMNVFIALKGIHFFIFMFADLYRWICFVPASIYSRPSSQLIFTTARVWLCRA